MAVYTTDPHLEEQLRAARAKSGADRYDEIWEGVLFMPPLANNEHQGLASQFGAVLHLVIVVPAVGTVYVGVNISDREEDWMYNCRVPDVAVFLVGNSARDCGTHWFGGPDFLIEIVSPDDRSWEKIPFYSQVGVREMLIIDRDPWKLELYRRRGAKLVLAGASSLEQPKLLESKVLPLRFRLLPGKKRPTIEVAHKDGSQRWSL